MIMSNIQLMSLSFSPYHSLNTEMIIFAINVSVVVLTQTSIYNQNMNAVCNELIVMRGILIYKKIKY